MAAESEKIYECQVKRRRLKLGGGYEPFWKLKSVIEALSDDDTEFRCPDCTGAVRLHRRYVVDAPLPYTPQNPKPPPGYPPAAPFSPKPPAGPHPRLSQHPVR